ncbi:MAG: hypothetical protein HY210_03530 [Candidatus Omnitrophica bacterium]|nr:hypothetical protein [Candidatus Omnitrophota bacterium]
MNKRKLLILPFTIYHLPLTNKKAQSALELAVFGAILIFVVGVIVRQALSSAYMQNQNLRAMRQAMTTSYQYSTMMGAERQASRRNASILFIEDRLTAESGRHAAVDRTPYVTGGSATYSRTLFYPIAWAETQQLPVYDMFINGKQLPFSTNAFLGVELARSCSGVSPCPPECKGDCDIAVPGLTPCANVNPCPSACVDNNGVSNCSGSSTLTYDACSGLVPCPPECTAGCRPGASIQFYPPANFQCANVNPCPAACNNDCSGTSTQVYPVAWEDNCINVFTTINTRCADVCNLGPCQIDLSADPPVDDCASNSTATWSQTQTETVGCAKLYDIIYNNPGFPEWCDDQSVACPANNLTADQRFDLDRDGTTDVPAGEARRTFAWQWYEVVGWNNEYSINESIQESERARSATPLKSGWIGKDMHNVVDVDQDLKRESIIQDPGVAAGQVAFSVPTDFETGIILRLQLLDSQRGDLDMTHGDSDPGPAPGVQKNVRMYSFVNGTYLLLEEGRLYAPDTGQYIRTAQKKDQVDIIERTIQLSNDTGRFCSGSTPNTDGNIWYGVPNPVEACENCYSSANIQKTCMDRVRKVILVRSRVQDLRGRKWVTNTSGDDNMNFTVPGVP